MSRDVKMDAHLGVSRGGYAGRIEVLGAERRQGRGLPFPCRQHGGHDNTARAAHANHAGLACRVRARPDMHPDDRMPRPRQGARRENEEAVETHGTPEESGNQAARSWRGNTLRRLAVVIKTR